jgi:hypothetical protein
VDRPLSVEPSRRSAHPMALLGGGVPLSLLLDLALGPHSEDLLRQERSAGQAERVRNPGQPARRPPAGPT